MKKKPTTKNPFDWTAQNEQTFRRALLKISRASAEIIKQHMEGQTSMLDDTDLMMHQLAKYSDRISDFATSASARMIKSANVRSRKSFRGLSKTIGKLLVKEFSSTVGVEARMLHMQQVDLIKSIPIESGRIAQQYAFESVTNGTRASYAASRLQEIEKISTAKATLIARTEIAKTNATLNRARATDIGVTHYHWQTVEDDDVRESHQEMDGKLCSYADPPEVEPGKHYHPGEIYNCRCFAVPVIPPDLTD